MPDTKAPESQDALSATWDINREFAGAVTLALLLLYHKFMNPFIGRLPDPESEEQAKLEPGTALDGEAPSSPGDSLHLDWLSELPEIPAAPACCTEIVGAIDQLTTAVKEIEACCKPAAEAPTADVHKRIEEIEREVRRATKPSPVAELLDWETAMGLAADIGTYLLGLSATLANILGAWVALEAAHLDEVLRRLAADPQDRKNWSAERLEGLEELDRRYPRSKSADEAVLDAFFAQAWSEWQRALRELIENIEAPDSTQYDREESLRVLPHVLEDIEGALELYRKRHGGHEAPFDPQLLDRAKDLLQRTPALESRLEPKQRDDADLLSWEGGGRGRASQDETDTLMPASYSFHDGPARPQHDLAPDQFERVMHLLESLAARLRDPVRLEVRVLDDRVIARRLDGNRSVDVDLSRGYRMVGYISV